MCSLYRQNGVLVFAENVLTEKEDEEKKNVYFAPILFLHENCEQIIVVLQGNPAIMDMERAIDTLRKAAFSTESEMSWR